eukprot:3059707-Prymnesium_polylepis.1
MTHGSFGGSSGRAHFCLQSMDGEVLILEGERVLHDGQLSKFLLPGALAYHPRADLFITTNAQMEVDCYKFSAFSAAGPPASGKAGKRKLVADWSIVVGEEVVSIEVGRFSGNLTSSQMDIIVVGARCAATPEPSPPRPQPPSPHPPSPHPQTLTRTRTRTRKTGERRGRWEGPVGDAGGTCGTGPAPSRRW